MSWLAKVVDKYINVDSHDIDHTTYYSTVDRETIKLDTIKGIIQLASLINTDGIKIELVDVPCFHRIVSLPIDNEFFVDNDPLGFPNHSNHSNHSKHKTFAVETYSTRCSVSQFGYSQKFDHGSIIEVHNNKLYNDILVKEMAQILNKKLLNASIFFIMEFCKIVEIYDQMAMNKSSMLNTRVCFNY